MMKENNKTTQAKWRGKRTEPFFILLAQNVKLFSVFYLVILCAVCVCFSSIYFLLWKLFHLLWLMLCFHFLLSFLLILCWYFCVCFFIFIFIIIIMCTCIIWLLLHNTIQYNTMSFLLISQGNHISWWYYGYLYIRCNLSI